jgi:Uncharacterized conserved protein
MWNKINRILKGQLVTSLLYTLLGLCFVLMPVDAVNAICKFVFGILLILAGIYHILIYVLEKMNATLLDLLSGGMLLVIGIFLFYNPQIVVKLLPVLLGTFVLVDSVWVLKGSLRLKKAGRGEWKILLIGSLIFIGFGIAMVINPFTMIKYTVIFAGGVMLANGVVDFVFLVLIRRGMKKAEEAVEEAVEQMKEAEIKEAEVKAEEPEADRDTEKEPEYTAWSDRRTVLEQKSEKKEEQEDPETAGSRQEDSEPVVSDAEEYYRKQAEKDQKRNDLIQKY